jgi:ubiquitin carboxyl-terminal hydrolase 34
MVSHSVQSVVAALTRSDLLETLGTSPISIQLAASLIECLLSALTGKPSRPKLLFSISLMVD